MCKVIEGLSHFNYVVWRAGCERALSLLELELQAEVDKFVSTMQLAMDNDDAELVNSLHTRLFSNIRFNEALDRIAGRTISRGQRVCGAILPAPEEAPGAGRRAQ